MGKERFLKVEREWKKEMITKECLVLEEVTFLWGAEAVKWVNHLLSADLLIPWCLVKVCIPGGLKWQLG